MLFPDLLKSPEVLLINLFCKYNSSSFVQENNTYVKEILYIGFIATYVSNRWNNVSKHFKIVVCTCSRQNMQNDLK